MNPQEKQFTCVAQIQSSLAKVVDIGHGNDECEHGMLVMFEDVVRQAVPCEELRNLTFKLPIRLPEKKNTYVHLLGMATEVQHYVEGEVAAVDREPRRGPVVFPFMTTLGISGGMFMIAFHVARLAPMVV